MCNLKIKNFVTKLMAIILTLAMVLSLSACDDTLSAPAGADAGYYMGIISTTSDYKTLHNTYVLANTAMINGNITYEEFQKIAEIYDERDMELEGERMRQIRAGQEG